MLGLFQSECMFRFSQPWHCHRPYSQTVGYRLIFHFHLSGCKYSVQSLCRSTKIIFDLRWSEGITGGDCVGKQQWLIDLTDTEPICNDQKTESDAEVGILKKPKITKSRR